MSNAAEQQYAEQGIVYLDPKMRIKNYWTQRSHSFAELRVRELNSVLLPTLGLPTIATTGLAILFHSQYIIK